MVASAATLTRVVVIGPDKPIYTERDSAEIITPGMVVQENASAQFIKNTRVGGTNNRVPMLVAIEDTLHASLGSGQTGGAGTLNDDWPSGSRVLAQHLRAGCEFMACVPAAAPAIAYDDPLTTAAGGFLVKGTEVNCVARARTAIDNSAGGTTVRVRALVI
jgi:hypothetical protein